MLAVSDDGSGMDKETLDRVFEPFFTTKCLGKGTGLGLANVYGIVKQNNGFINVYSEPGQGTTFRIYIPRHEGVAGELSTGKAPAIPLGRGQKVLLVEDEQAIRRLGEAILKKLGYQVVATSMPDEAIRLAQENGGTIDLLLTDVVMPGMSGHQLADQLHAIYPEIKILYMSGYTSDVISHRGVLPSGVNFIHKPFTQRDLAVKLHEVLG
jgi:CheY-like chemotaxis protein